MEDSLIAFNFVSVKIDTNKIRQLVEGITGYFHRAYYPVSKHPVNTGWRSD